MHENLSVRSAAVADVEAIQSVADAAWHAAYDDVLGTETVDEMLAEGYDEAVLREMIELDDVGLFVAVDDGVVGYASCGRTDTAGLGDLDMYAHPDHWGSGVGEALLERGRAHLAGLGVERVRDEVLVENDVGIAFYDKHFERVGTRQVEIAGDAYEVAVYELDVE
ncbi:MAG: N-acetyltransferase family protein [Haloarculaceae archaeon]